MCLVIFPGCVVYLVWVISEKLYVGYTYIFGVRVLEMRGNQIKSKHTSITQTEKRLLEGVRLCVMWGLRSLCSGIRAGDPPPDPDALVTLCYTEKTGSVTGGTVENKRTEATCYISYTCYRKINIIIYFPWGCLPVLHKKKKIYVGVYVFLV